MDTKTNNSESNKVATTETKKAQKLSVSFTVRALIENVNRLAKAGLIEAEDIETVKEIGTRATLKGLGL